MIEYKPGFRDTVTLATQRVVWIRCGFRAPVTLATQGVEWIRCGFRVTVTLTTQGLVWIRCGFRVTVTLATQGVVWIRCGFRVTGTLATQAVLWIRCGFRVTVTLAIQGVVWIRCGFSYCNTSYSRGGVNQMWMLICLSIYWRYSNGYQLCTSSCRNRIGGVMISVLASSVVDRGFEFRLGHTKDYKIGICCFSGKHTALKRKSKDWLARNQVNVSEWGDMSIHRLLFQCASTIKIQLSMLV